MRAAGCFFLAPLLLGAALAGQSPPKGFSEVPKEKLERLKLVLPDANCALTAPGAEWKWYAADASPGKKYLCFNARTGAGYAVSIGSLDTTRLTRTRASRCRPECARRWRPTARKSGTRNSSLRQRPCPASRGGSTTNRHSKAGLKIGSVIYLVQPAEHALVTLQDSTPDGAESPAFSQFVKALSLLK